MISLRRGAYAFRFNFNRLSTNKLNYFSSRSYPNEVTIVEVGPRDGLQNEKVYLILDNSLFEKIH